MYKLNNCIDGVVVRVIQSIVVDQAKDYVIDINCFSAKQRTLRRKIKD